MPAQAGIQRGGDAGYGPGGRLSGAAKAHRRVTKIEEARLHAHALGRIAAGHDRMKPSKGGAMAERTEGSITIDAGPPQVMGVIADFPHDLSRLIRAARCGRLEIHVDITNLKHVGNQLDGAANRLTVGVVVSALIVGSSIVMTVKGGPEWLGLPLFGFVGYLGAAMGGIWLLLSIWRSARADRE